MIGLRTNDLILRLANYTFYDWENHSNSEKVIHFGMTRDILTQYGIKDFIRIKE